MMGRWQRAEVENSWFRHANDDPKKKGEKEKKGWGVLDIDVWP